MFWGKEVVLKMVVSSSHHGCFNIPPSFLHSSPHLASNTPKLGRRGNRLISGPQNQKRKGLLHTPKIGQQKMENEVHHWHKKQNNKPVLWNPKMSLLHNPQAEERRHMKLTGIH